MVVIQRGVMEIVLSDEHAGYAPSVVANFWEYFGATVGHGERVDYSEKAVHEYPNGLKLETPSLPETWEDYCRYFTPTKHDLVFDFGAYSGYSTLRLAELAGKVIAFEPDPETRRSLTKNVKGHKNVKVVPYALSGTGGTRKFFGESSPGSRLARPEYERGSMYPIETVSLEHCYKVFGVPGFVKMDIEGAELEVLNASKELLRENPVFFAIDTHHRIPGVGWTWPKVEAIFRDCGYEVVSDNKSGFWTTWANPK